MFIDDKIPRTTSLNGLKYLAHISRSAPADGRFLDAGTFYGAVASVFAGNAPSQAEVFAVDTWEQKDWIERFRKEKNILLPFCKASFEELTRAGHGIFPLEGDITRILEDWKKPFDVIFLDTMTTNPHFRTVLSLAVDVLKPEGVICGENYNIRSPDIVHEVDNLARSWGVHPEVRGRIWSLRKPPKGKKTSRGVSPLSSEKDCPGISVTADCDFMSPASMPPECWAGRQGKNGALRAFKLQWVNRPEGVDVISKCAATGLPSSKPVASGRWCQADNMKKPIISVCLELTGERAAEYELRFQAGFVRDGRASFHEKMNSRFIPGGKWLKSPSRGTPLSALRVIITHRVA